MTKDEKIEVIEKWLVELTNMVSEWSTETKDLHENRGIEVKEVIDMKICAFVNFCGKFISASMDSYVEKDKRRQFFLDIMTHISSCTMNYLNYSQDMKMNFVNTTSVQ